MNKQFLGKYANLAIVVNSCDNSRLALSALKKEYDFKPRIVGRIDNAIEAMDIITTVLLGLMNIEEEEQEIIMQDKRNNNKEEQNENVQQNSE